MERELMELLGGSDAEALGVYEMRLLTARQLLEARREAGSMAGDRESRGLRSNACRSLYRNGAQAFPNGETLLGAWSAEDIGRAMERYEAMAEKRDPPWDEEGRLEELRQQLSREPEERIRWRVLRAFGVLPSERRALEMTRGDYLLCALHLMLDRQEQLDGLCPQCRDRLEENRCSLCGGVMAGEMGENPHFDRKKFEEMKKHG